MGERRSAQRIKRVLADTTPKHLEQLTKQARMLAGDDDGEADFQDSSMDVIRRRLGHLQQRHTVLREKLTNANPPQRSLVARLQEEFENEPEGKCLEAEEWNDSVIKELQKRIYDSDAALSMEDDQEMNEPFEGKEDAENLTLLVNHKVIRGVKGRHIAIRFDTTFEEKKFESYYCVLKSSSPMDKLHVIEHSIPFFLPVRELEKQHLGNSPKLFIDYIGNVLQAYVSRREQVNKLKKRRGELIGELYHSLSYTLIEIMLKQPQWQVGMSLAYHNLDSELPTQSTITTWPLTTDLISQAVIKPGRAVQKNSTAFRLPKAEAFLRTMPLPQGCEELLADLRDTLGLSPPPEQATEAPPPPTVALIEAEMVAPTKPVMQIQMDDLVEDPPMDMPQVTPR